MAPIVPDGAVRSASTPQAGRAASSTHRYSLCCSSKKRGGSACGGGGSVRGLSGASAPWMAPKSLQGRIHGVPRKSPHASAAQPEGPEKDTDGTLRAPGCAWPPPAPGPSLEPDPEESAMD